MMNHLPSDYGKSREFHLLSKVEFPARTLRRYRPVLKTFVGLNGNYPASKDTSESPESSLSLLRTKRLLSKRQIYKTYGHGRIVIAEEKQKTDCGKGDDNQDAALLSEDNFDHVVKGNKLPSLRKSTFTSNQQTEVPYRRYPKEILPLKKFAFRTESKKERRPLKIKSSSLSIGSKGDLKSSSDDTVSLSPSDRPLSRKSSSTTRKRPKKIVYKDFKSTYPLQPSLFPNVPPFLNFTTSNDKPKKLPAEIRNVLRWRLPNATPALITQIIARSGFEITEDNTVWVSTWGKHANCQVFKELGDNQKVNHFPGTFHLGRKDRLWMNILKMQVLHGREHFSFMPQTFVLPQHLKQLRSAWVETGCRTRWIIKPPASARGVGVSVIHRWNDVPKTESVIVQKYVSRPYLINDTKFDLRLYTLVTSFDPLRLYVFDDGLVRFASEKYSRSLKCLGEKFIHLTNYSINRNNTCYTTNDDENICQGHKWTLKSLWSYFRENGIDDKKVWSSLMDVVIKTLISCEEPINRLVKIYAKNRYSCYELFGFDIMLDYSLKPWLLEVNISPSLHSNSRLDINVKSQLIKDMFNTVGFHIPVEINLNSSTQIEVSKRSGIFLQKGISWNKDLYGFIVNREERAKQIKFERNGWSQSSILKHLSPDDVRQLIQSEDELSRCGNFVRVFPSEISSSYLRYFESPRYYNLLLDAWERRHYNRRNAGILLLQSLCKRGIHLQVTDSYEDRQIKMKSLESFRSKSTNKFGNRKMENTTTDQLVSILPLKSKFTTSERVS